MNHSNWKKKQSTVYLLWKKKKDYYYYFKSLSLLFFFNLYKQLSSFPFILFFLFVKKNCFYKRACVR